jgi:hypothetical protein
MRGDIIEIVGYTPEDVEDMTREKVRITHIGADGRIEGERWDDAQRRYRSIKPVALTQGAQHVAFEFADKED